jgi:hypothetical protein
MDKVTRLCHGDLPHVYGPTRVGSDVAESGIVVRCYARPCTRCMFFRATWSTYHEVATWPPR